MYKNRDWTCTNTWIPCLRKGELPLS
jgi:hypothetical protein